MTGATTTEKAGPSLPLALTRSGSRPQLASTTSAATHAAVLNPSRRGFQLYRSEEVMRFNPNDARRQGLIHSFQTLKCTVKKKSPLHPNGIVCEETVLT